MYLKKVRNRCLENYGLYPSLYLRTPALSWNAKIIRTKVRLDLISDVGMHLCFEMLEVVLFIFLKNTSKQTVNI